MCPFARLLNNILEKVCTQSQPVAYKAVRFFEHLQMWNKNQKSNSKKKQLQCNLSTMLEKCTEISTTIFWGVYLKVLSHEIFKFILWL